jgi:hypothetical protein
MNPAIERNLGEQPIARLMREHNLKPHDLVAASPVEMTHKMVARARKGRRLSLTVLQSPRELLTGFQLTT